jgi:hypothetical protein
VELQVPAVGVGRNEGRRRHPRDPRPARGGAIEPDGQWPRPLALWREVDPSAERRARRAREEARGQAGRSRG